MSEQPSSPERQAEVVHPDSQSETYGGTLPATDGTTEPTGDDGTDAGGEEPAHPGGRGSTSVVLVGPDGQGTVMSSSDGGPASLVSAPDKVMRIGTMIKQLLEEVKAAPLDERSRLRLADLHGRSIAELSDGLAPELRDELGRLALPFGADEVPSDAELRIAQAQLVGWLEGVFHGIQAALVAQQVNTRIQLEQMRGRPQLAPPGRPEGTGGGTGQYL